MSTLLWVVFPYLCLAVFVVGHVWRWRTDQFGWTTHTTQLLENRILRWASPLFHLGAFGVIVGHAIGLIVPAWLTGDLGISEDLYHPVAVWGGAITGTMMVVGLVGLMVRRITNPRVRPTTLATDHALYTLLAVMAALGMIATIGINLIGNGYDYREGVSLWFRGIFQFSPHTAAITDAPLVYQLHAVGGFLLIALWPFTRLVHVWSAPIAYLWRPYVVYRARRGPVPTAQPSPGHVRDAAFVAAHPHTFEEMERR